MLQCTMLHVHGKNKSNVSQSRSRDRVLHHIYISILWNTWVMSSLLFAHRVLLNDYQLFALYPLTSPSVTDSRLQTPDWPVSPHELTSQHVCSVKESVQLPSPGFLRQGCDRLHRTAKVDDERNVWRGESSSQVSTIATKTKFTVTIESF